MPWLDQQRTEPAKWDIAAILEMFIKSIDVDLILVASWPYVLLRSTGLACLRNAPSENHRFCRTWWLAHDLLSGSRILNTNETMMQGILAEHRFVRFYSHDLIPHLFPSLAPLFRASGLTVVRKPPAPKRFCGPWIRSWR